MSSLDCTSLFLAKHQAHLHRPLPMVSAQCLAFNAKKDIRSGSSPPSATCCAPSGEALVLRIAAAATSEHGSRHDWSAQRDDWAMILCLCCPQGTKDFFWPKA